MHSPMWVQSMHSWTRALCVAQLGTTLKLEAQLLKRRLQPERLSSVLDRASCIIAPQLQPGCTLKLTSPRDHIGGSEPIVLIDSKMILQIIINLGQNAARFTSAGCVELCCHVGHGFTHKAHDDDHGAPGVRNIGVDEAVQGGGGGGLFRNGSSLPSRQALSAATAQAVQYTYTHANVDHPDSDSKVPVTIIVRDSGEGISEEAKGRLFDRYATTGGGLGLGLHLVAKQVACLGGRMNVESPWTNDHAGSAFKFTFLAKVQRNEAPADNRGGGDRNEYLTNLVCPDPTLILPDTGARTGVAEAVEAPWPQTDRAPAALLQSGRTPDTLEAAQPCTEAEAPTEAGAAVEAEAKAPEEAKAKAPEEAKATAPVRELVTSVVVGNAAVDEPRQRRVLVADDAVINRRLLRRAFEKYFDPPWHVSEATTAPEALNVLKTAAVCGQPYDLFIADENYEPVDVTKGTEVIRELRSYEAAHGLPRMAVILCTGNSDAANNGNDGSIDLCWIKPFPKFADGTMQAAVMAMFDRV